MNIKNTLILTLSLLSLTAAQAAAPVNDSILKPIKLSGLYSTHPVQDLSLATADVMDPMIAGTSAGKTLWYSFPHHPTSGMLQITVTSNTGVGTASLFSAEDPENPRGSLRQETNVAFTTGQTISVSASYFGKPLFLMLAGTGQISVTHRLIVASYDFPQIAYALSGEYGTVYIDNSAASNTADEPALPPGAGAMTNIVWLKWTPAFSGMAYFDTNFSYSGGSPTYSHYSPPLLHDTQIALYAAQSGGGPTGLTPISFDDGSGYGGNNYRFRKLGVSAGDL